MSHIYKYILTIYKEHSSLQDTALFNIGKLSSSYTLISPPAPVGFEPTTYGLEESGQRCTVSNYTSLYSIKSQKKIMLVNGY
jgi:hypothetical protein